MDEGQRVIAYLLARLGGRVHSTKLVKMVYFVDYVYVQNFGQTATGFKYQWDHYGPNAVGHAIIADAHKLADLELIHEFAQENIYGGLAVLFKSTELEGMPPLDPTKVAVIEDVIAQFGSMGIREITAASKRTAPFKNARQYDLLDLEQTHKPLSTTREDTAAYFSDATRHPPITLEEMKVRIGLT